MAIDRMRSDSLFPGTWRPRLVIVLALVVMILAVFLPVLHHEFVEFDDPDYVTNNAHVLSGLTWESITWAFTTPHASNWHPLTWMSHMLDVELFGLNSGGHHLVNVVFHTFNALLLFAVLGAMTGALWRSAAVAALFAVHPLHVESVAWVAERKDVLSTFFWLLTTISYVWYVRVPGIGRYFLVVLFFTLGLLSKPMLVTLPVVLVLLDFWPLKRWRDEDAPSGSSSPLFNHAFLLRSFREKVPLLVLAVASSVTTFLVQHDSGAVMPLFFIPLHQRLINALSSYAMYVYKMFWPHPLYVFYPYVGTYLPPWQIVGSLALLAGVSAAAAVSLRRYPYLSGWFWYVLTLLPVIGIVQVGVQGMAERYTYVPLVGLFIVLSWGACDVLKRVRRRNVVAALAGGAILVALMMVARNQVGYWSRHEKLWQHAVEVNAGNFRAHAFLGEQMARDGRMNEARSHFSQALKINPGYGKARARLRELEGKGVAPE